MDKDLNKDMVEDWLNLAVNSGRYKGKPIGSNLELEDNYTAIDYNYQNLSRAFDKLINESSDTSECIAKIAVIIQTMLDKLNEKLNDVTNDNTLTNYEISKLNTLKNLYSSPSGNGLNIDSNNIKTDDNPYPTIFENNVGYKIFMEWHKKFKTDTSKQVANYSFLIRNMIKDKLMLDVKHSVYLELLSKHNVNITKIKQLNECTINARNTIYLDLKKQFDLKKQ